ncbi:MAG: sulfotransferase [Rhizobiaceae bacterium]|nr:sulfotransferase [Rhizobiaceae bacterium]
MKLNINGFSLPQKFFIVGAQKAGTTALHKYLARHSQLSLSVKKELHFFDNETRDWERPSYKLLETGMGCSTGKICGEATPIYMYWPDSIERLHTYDPSAQIIVLLRHPVFRAHSHWRMETKRGAENLSFPEAIRGGRSRVKEAPGGVHRVYSYIERGFYAEQIKRILQYYPHSQVHIATTDQLWLEPKSTLNAVERFLNIKEELDPEWEYIIAARTDIPDQITTADFVFLMDLFHSDIRAVSKITGIPLDNWLDDHYLESDKYLK